MAQNRLTVFVVRLDICSLFTYVESVRKLHFQEQEHRFMRRKEGVDKTKKLIFLPRGGTYVNSVTQRS